MRLRILKGVDPPKLVSGRGDSVSTDMFHFLTGKKLPNLLPRQEIIVERSGGHIHFYDTKMVDGNIYRRPSDRRFFICVYSDRSGATLSPLANALEVVHVEVKDQCQWELYIR